MLIQNLTTVNCGHISFCSKDKKTLLQNPVQVKACWHEHFSELLNCRSEVDFGIIDTLSQLLHIEELDTPPGFTKVVTAIKKMK